MQIKVTLFSPKVNTLKWQMSNVTQFVARLYTIWHITPYSTDQMNSSGIV